MENRKKLYRSLTGTALMLFAGLVLAPNLINSSFHSAGQKVAAAGPQPAPELALQPTPKNIPHKLRDTPAQPAQTNPAGTRPADETPQPAPQTGESEQPEHAGPTTFAVNDFMPERPSFPSGGASHTDLAVASSDTRGDVAKIIHMPKPAVTDNGDKSSNNNDAPHNNDGHPNTPEHENHETAGPDEKPNGDLPPPQSIAGNNPGEHPVVSVPEPSSIVLLMAGLAGLMIARRRG